MSGTSWRAGHSGRGVSAGPTAWPGPRPGAGHYPRSTRGRHATRAAPPCARPAAEARQLIPAPPPTPQNAAARDRSRSSSCRGPAPQKGSSGGTVAPTGVTPRPLGWPAGCRARSRLSSVWHLLTGRPLGCSRPASPPGASRGSLLPATGLPAAAREGRPGLTRPRLLPDRAGARGRDAARGGAAERGVCPSPVYDTQPHGTLETARLCRKPGEAGASVT